MGFTLIELLLVISILLLLTLLVISVYNANAGSDRMRSGARVAQSALLAARDRALHAKERRGLRLIRDPNDATVVTGFQYIQPVPSFIAGMPGAQTVIVARPNATMDYQTSPATLDNPIYLVVLGAQGQRLFEYDSAGYFPYGLSRVRIPAQTGSWYQLLPISNNPPFYAQQQNVAGLGPSPVTVIQLQTAVEGVTNPFSATQAIAPSDTNASAEFELGNELLPYHSPIPLPSGVVIDLDWCSLNVQVLFPVNTPPQPPTNIDIMYSPRGSVVGTVSAQGPLHFLLNDIRDATTVTASGPRAGLPLSPIDPDNKGEKLVLTLFPATGNVATFPIDRTDVIDNITLNPGQDGVPDDLFHFAKIGSVSGQ